MTVAELIALLQAENPEWDVVLEVGESITTELGVITAEDEECVYITGELDE